MFLENIIESIFGTALFVNALLFVPQIVKLLTIKNSKGLSIITFLGFNLIQIAVILHGILKNDYLLIIGYTISLITCGIVTILIIFYKIRNRSIQ